MQQNISKLDLDDTYKFVSISSKNSDLTVDSITFKTTSFYAFSQLGKIKELSKGSEFMGSDLQCLDNGASNDNKFWVFDINGKPLSADVEEYLKQIDSIPKKSSKRPVHKIVKQAKESSKEVETGIVYYKKAAKIIGEGDYDSNDHWYFDRRLRSVALLLMVCDGITKKHIKEIFSAESDSFSEHHFNKALQYHRSLIRISGSYMVIKKYGDDVRYNLLQWYSDKNEKVEKFAALKEMHNKDNETRLREYRLREAKIKEKQKKEEDKLRDFYSSRLRVIN